MKRGGGRLFLLAVAQPSTAPRSLLAVHVPREIPLGRDPRLEKLSATAARSALSCLSSPSRTMKDKARANLLASRILLEAELVDPSMSRLYYALFQAGVHTMTVQGRTPGDFTRDARDWTHASICGNAFLLRSDRRDPWLFQEARTLRERADYRVEAVDRRLIERLLPLVEAFLNEVCA
jgi:hypothetical protein